MSAPRPKFCVGEVVDIRSRFGFRVDGAEVLSCRYIIMARDAKTGEILPPGWEYKTNKDPNHHPWAESALRKRPQNNWENSVWKPEEVTA